MNRADNNLEPTIELDGQPYNITAVDALWADIARRVQNILTINESKLKSGIEITDATEINKDIQTLNPIEYDGSEDKQVSVVSSDGGVFTGPIYIPDILAPNEDLDNDISANKKAAVNLNSLETLISAIKGFPILKWDGTGLNEDGDNSGAIEPFKVILYSSDKEETIGNIPSKYYFLLVNTDTGYLRLGRPKGNGAGSQYIDLGVLYANQSKVIAALDTDGSIITNKDPYYGKDSEVKHVDHSRKYDYDYLRRLSGRVYGFHKDGPDENGNFLTTESRYKNGLEDIVSKILDNLYGENYHNFFDQNTDFGLTSGQGGVTGQVKKNTTDISTNKTNISTNTTDIANHTGSTTIHRNITWGTGEPKSTDGSENDIYIKLESSN